MKKLLMILIVAAIALGSTACYHNKVVMSPNYDPSQEIPDADKIAFHIIDYISINAEMNLAAECPHGAGIVEDRLFFRFYGLSLSQMRVFCNRTSADLSEPAAPEMAALQN